MSRKSDHGQTMLFTDRHLKGNSTSESFSDMYRFRTDAMNTVIANLRLEDLDHGHCFLIFDNDLPEGEALYEYPDGSIRIEKVDENNIELPRTVIKVLNDVELIAVREKHAVGR